MTFNISIKNDYNDENFFYIENFANSSNFEDALKTLYVSKAQIGLLKFFFPVRTDDFNHFCKDLFLPSVFNMAMKAHSQVDKVIFTVICFCLDMTTLIVRVITAIPRYLYNKQYPKENHPLYRFLLQKGISPDLLKTDYLFIRYAWTGKDTTLYLKQEPFCFIDQHALPSVGYMHDQVYLGPSNAQLKDLGLPIREPLIELVEK